jgi:homoserine kinase type II
MPNRDFFELLARYPSHIQPLSELKPQGNAGGFSGARLWRFQAQPGDLVLRSWPPHGPARAQLENIHRWLFLTSETGLTPVPVRDKSARSIQEFEGTLWEITPWLPGRPDSANPPSPARLHAAFAALAALHSRWAVQIDLNCSPGLALRCHAVEALIRGGFDVIEAALASQPPSSGLVFSARQWLALARSVAPTLHDALRKASRSILNLQPCLRDARPEHFLFEQDRLSGIIDFGAMGVDCVAGDLARLIGDWLDGDSDARARALTAYEQIRPLEPVESSLIRVFESSADLLIGERWLHWHLLEGRRFDDPDAVSKGLDRGLRRLERLALSLGRDLL